VSEDNQQDILAHIRQLTSVSPELDEALRQRLRYHSVARHSHIHQAGAVCQRTYWIRSGLMRLYYLKEGREVTDFFSAEGEWITSAYSFMRGEPDQFYLQALEDCQLFSLTIQDLGWLFTHFPAMERFGRIVITQQFIQQSERLNSLQFSTAAERYTHFCQTYPALLPRLPLGMIASYLGITQETLSRIRAAF